MSRHPSRSLVSTVATGSDNQRGFCLGLKVRLLALPRAIFAVSSSSVLTTTLLSLDISPVQYPHCLVLFRLVYVLACASTNPSAFDTASFAYPPPLRSSRCVLAEFMLENHPLPLPAASSPRDKAIKCTLRLPAALLMAIHGVLSARRRRYAPVAPLRWPDVFGEYAIPRRIEPSRGK